MSKIPGAVAQKSAEELKNLRLCSLHFRPNDFRVVNEKHILTETAVLCRFLEGDDNTTDVCTEIDGTNVVSRDDDGISSHFRNNDHSPNRRQ